VAEEVSFELRVAGWLRRKMAIKYYNDGTDFRLPGKGRAGEWLRRVVESEGGRVEGSAERSGGRGAERSADRNGERGADRNGERSGGMADGGGREKGKSGGLRLGAVNFIFCSPERHLEINRQFLGHDYQTDVITFDYSEVASREREGRKSTARDREVQGREARGGASRGSSAREREAQDGASRDRAGEHREAVRIPDKRSALRISGDIFIDPETVALNAADHLAAPEVEMRRVMVHGVLHLCGYGDKTPKEQRQMRAKEDYYLAKYYERV
jgi:rRNA maturation RNase YbeY